MRSFQIDPTDTKIAGILHVLKIHTRKSVTVHEARDTYEVFPSQWDSGSREFTSHYRCAGKHFKTFASGLVRQIITLGPEGVIGTHGTFRGKEAFVSLYVAPGVYAQLEPVPSNVTLTDEQSSVLRAIATYNSRGRKEWREDHKVSREAWDTIIATLVPLGLVKKNGAITPAGRNHAN